MNIYVAPELQAQMRKYSAVINWSKVAAKAFAKAMVDHDEQVARSRMRIRTMQLAYRWTKRAVTEASTIHADAFMTELDRGY
jgi:hypothetical protein